MEWFTRLGAMYQLFNNVPPLAYDMAVRGPQNDHAYALAYAAQNTAEPIDVYPSDLEG